MLYMYFQNVELFSFAFNKSKKYAKTRNEAIRTQFEPSKPKWDITKITNSQNTKRT